MTTITQTARLRVAARLRDGQELLARVEKLEQEIAVLLGLSPVVERDGEVITDAVATGRSVDMLLRDLDITVEAGGSEPS